MLMLSQEVWGWGCYKDKEGGKWFNPSTSTGLDVQGQKNTPVRINGLSNIAEIACGSSFNLVRLCLRLVVRH